MLLDSLETEQRVRNTFSCTLFCLVFSPRLVGFLLPHEDPLHPHRLHVASDELAHL